MIQIILPFNPFYPEARLSQQLDFLGALSTQGTPRKYIDLNHIIMNGLPFKFHSNFKQILQKGANSDRRKTFTFSRENTESAWNELTTLSVN